ncbi:hypothetical protein DFH11DRAFT_1542852 [Phellopilus nigrolimitatus]|nr:hypothetical protein DFH11DRAFT_1542852 [Phellopilus nigrolimitatus]
MSRPHPKPAVILNADKPTQPPVLTDGFTTPMVLDQWFNHAENFHSLKDIEDDHRVKKVAGGLQPVRARNWYYARKADVDALDWDEFKEQVRATLLETGWDRKERLALNAVHQEGRTIAEFENDILRRNVLLRGTGSEMTPGQIRFHMEANMDCDTMQAAAVARTHTIQDYEDWIAAITATDEQCRIDRERLTDALALRAANKKITRAPMPAAVASASRITNDGPVLGKLSAQERTLLAKHNGCFKCRHYYADHRANNCTTPRDRINHAPLSDAAASIPSPTFHAQVAVPQSHSQTSNDETRCPEATSPNDAQTQ